jgi:signal transduction histidine kinase
MTYHTKAASIYAYLCAGCTLAAVLIAFVANIEANRQNAFSLNTQIAIAEYETNDGYLAFAGKLSPEANWTTAYRHVTRKWDPAWIKKEYGDYLKSISIPHVAVFGPDNKLRFLSRGNGETVFTAATVARAGGLAELLAAVRAESPQKPPLESRGIVIIGGMPYLAAAAAITPDDKKEAPTAFELQNTLVYFKPLREDAYGALSFGFQAKNVRISTNAKTPPGFVALALKDAAGRPRAFLEWEPYTPGTNFLARLLPIMFGLFALLIAVLAVVFWRWHKAQQNLAASEAKASMAEEESRIKSVFLGNVSHELRTPLNAIIGFAEVMKMQMFGPLGAKRYEEYIAHILTSGSHLLKIVNDLIEISQLEDNAAAVPLATVDAAVCLREAVEAAQAEAAAKHLTIVYEGSDRGAWCLGSAQRLRQALARLMDNALLFSDPGQTVTVSWRRDGDEISVGVRDQDTDLPEDLAENIGKLFQYSDTHLVARHGGIGLGLVIAKSQIQSCGGRMSAHCTPGEGTTLTLYLPAAAAPPQTVGDAQQAAA